MTNYFITELEEIFQEKAFQLLKQVTAQGAIIVKKIGGKAATCKKLYDFMKHFNEQIERGKPFDNCQSYIEVSRLVRH